MTFQNASVDVSTQFLIIRNINCLARSAILSKLPGWGLRGSCSHWSLSAARSSTLVGCSSLWISCVRSTLPPGSHGWFSNSGAHGLLRCSGHVSEYHSGQCLVTTYSQRPVLGQYNWGKKPRLSSDKGRGEIMSDWERRKFLSVWQYGWRWRTRSSVKRAVDGKEWMDDRCRTARTRSTCNGQVYRMLVAWRWRRVAWGGGELLTNQWAWVSVTQDGLFDTEPVLNSTAWRTWTLDSGTRTCQWGGYFTPETDCISSRAKQCVLTMQEIQRVSFRGISWESLLPFAWLLQHLWASCPFLGCCLHSAHPCAGSETQLGLPERAP